MKKRWNLNEEINDGALDFENICHKAAIWRLVSKFYSHLLHRLDISLFRIKNKNVLEHKGFILSFHSLHGKFNYSFFFQVNNLKKWISSDIDV